MAQPPQPKPIVTTIPITNFGGRLSRIANGDMNSGFAKFTSSFGYDPFSKPMNLTWLENPSDITGSIANLLVGAKPRSEGSNMFVYGVDSAGVLYKIQSSSATNPNVDIPSVIGVVTAGSDTYNYGASLDFFRTLIYVGGDLTLHSVTFSGSGDTVIGSSTNYLANSYKPLRQFIGKLLFGNGNTIGAIDSTGTITSSIIGTGVQNLYSQLNPPLPVDQRVADLDVSVNYDYLLITSSGIPTENLTSLTGDRIAAQASDGAVFKWNGSDVGATAATTVPSYAVTALQTYMGSNMFFSRDAFGSSISDGVKKLLTLQGNKSAFANATTTNGNFLTWIVPEVNPAGTTIKASLYYFGSLDNENPPGLYRVLRYTSPLTNGFVYQTPINLMVNNKYSGINSSRSSVMSAGFGKHYLSTYEVNENLTTPRLLRFLITPTGTGTPQSGVYETQNQLFSKRISIAQIRFYCEPTVAGNGFQLDVIGGDGNVVANSTFAYAFGDPKDSSTGSSSLERINFNPNIGTLFSCGLRITNTGTTNMTIKKIEIDYSEEGK